eukprot:scpid98028/ scgid24966/ 
MGFSVFHHFAGGPYTALGAASELIIHLCLTSSPLTIFSWAGTPEFSSVLGFLPFCLSNQPPHQCTAQCLFSLVCKRRETSNLGRIQDNGKLAEPFSVERGGA